MPTIKRHFNFNSFLLTIVLGLLAFFGSRQVNQMDAVSTLVTKHDTILTAVQDDIKDIKITLKEVPSRTELNNKITGLRNSVNTDNQAEHAAERLIKNNNAATQN